MNEEFFSRKESVKDIFFMIEGKLKKGLFKEQIEAWKKTCLSANTQEENRTKALSIELKEEKKQARQLEKELRKKEKALAEAAALLLLRKKAQAIWGDLEEE